jgi:hypothetical protein
MYRCRLPRLALIFSIGCEPHRMSCDASGGLHGPASTPDGLDLMRRKRLIMRGIHYIDIWPGFISFGPECGAAFRCTKFVDSIAGYKACATGGFAAALSAHEHRDARLVAHPF